MLGVSEGPTCPLLGGSDERTFPALASVLFLGGTLGPGTGLISLGIRARGMRP